MITALFMHIFKAVAIPFGNPVLLCCAHFVKGMCLPSCNIICPGFGWFIWFCQERTSQGPLYCCVWNFIPHCCGGRASIWQTALLGTYFIFDIIYPKPLYSLLIMLQHHILNLPDAQKDTPAVVEMVTYVDIEQWLLSLLWTPPLSSSCYDWSLSWSW